MSPHISSLGEKDTHPLNKTIFCHVTFSDIIEEPMLSLCCRTIIGCKKCVEQWKEASSHCAQCRKVNSSVIEVAGLTAAFSVLKSFFTEE